MTSFKPAKKINSQHMTLWRTILQEQAKLLQLIRQALPITSANAIRHCVASGQQLIIYVDSAAWATQLRFQQDKIITALVENGVTQIKTVQIRRLQQTQAVNSKRLAVLPSQDTLTALKKACPTTTDDELEQALKRLSLTLERRLSEKPED